jgi:electron transport complex protein RnfG
MKIRDILKLGIVLMFYTAAACVGLAFVYAGTKDTIEIRAKADNEAALKVIFPDADSFEEIKDPIKSSDSSVSFGTNYAIRKGGVLVGAVLEATGGSYGGPIKVLVGVNANGTIARIKIMEHSDTPGLGANAVKATYYVNKANKITFYDQFAGKALSDPFEPKNDVIAISAATVTSRAVSNVVKAAGVAAVAWLGVDSSEGVNR